MSMVKKSVHRGAGEEVVAEQGMPLLESTVGGQDHRAALVAPLDDLVEVDGLIMLERTQSEVVDDEQVGAGEAQQTSLVALVGT